MKKYLSAILFFFFAVTVQAQYQSSFWGMTYDGGNGGGVIFRTNGYGDSLEVKHTFISSPGRNSLYSQLCEAPNGKLYGMTYGGGAYDYGVLFEYDKQTGTYQAKIIFSGAANGRNPYGSLIQASNGKLYGMTYGGGTNGQGVLFEYDPSTDTYTKKIDFSSAVSGRNPYGTLMEASNGMLYGLTSAGGANNMGVLFEYNPSTEVLTKKWDFDGAASGRNPYGTLMEASNGMLYGMTYSGGSNGYGVLFEYNPVSTVLAKKADFTGTANGRGPYGALVEFSNGLLYGMTPMGGASGYGVLFEYDPASAVLTKKWDFDGPTYGRTPYGSLMTACGKLYGLTSSGGSNTKGVLFDFDPASGILSKRMDFDGIPAGSSPFGSLMLASDGKIYGLTYSGGLNNYGVLFEYDCATDGFIKKVDFSETTNGGYPFGSLVNTSGHDLYGMTTYGGTSDFGVLFLYNPVSATYTRRVDFSGIPNGGYPVGNLLDASNGLLYGITYGGGAFDKGVLFEYNPATDTYVTKRNLDSATTGSFPYGSLIETSTGILYGMTSFGGSTNLGVIFSYNYITDSYTVKKTFDGAASGKNPYGDFVLAGNGKLYAMTYAGGANDLGVLFEYDIATNTYTKKIDFDGTTNGANPYGSLIEASNGKLYGLTSKGGTNNMGVLFEYNPLTSVFIKRIDFTGAANGNGPQGTLMESSGGKLYGMTYSGGTNNLGVLFEFDPGSGILTKKFDFDAEKGKNPYYTKLIEVCDPPGFIFPVSDASVCLNENTFFICAATGNWLTYQWQVDTGSGFADVVDNTVYSGAQNDTLFLYGVGAGMNGYLYRCVVSSSCPDSVIFSQTGVLNVRPHYEFTENTEICDNEDYFWHGTMYATTGTYYDSLQTIYGCDSVYILHLLVHPTYEYTLNAEICDNEVYTWRGNDYTFSGTYYDSLQTLFGCDSVYILHLLVHPTYENTLNAEICDNEVYTWRGNDYTFSGTYYDSLQTLFGCDSVYILHLLVHPTYENTLNAEICDNEVYTWRGNDYTFSGTYYDSLQTLFGCDSVYILHLLVHPTYEYTLNVEICDNEVYTWRGNNYTFSGTYYDSLQTLFGCDSVYILHLLVHPTHEYTFNAEICDNEVYTWRGNDYTFSGTYYDSLQTMYGCDSVYILHLLVHPTYENTLNADICDDEVYTWRGNSYSFTGTYYDSLQTMFGCDSVYILRLQVHPSYVHQQSAVICSNQSIIWRGNSYNTTGTYYDSLQTVHGCDSIFVLHLQANPVYTFTENAEICSGQDYFWRGNSYNTTGTFIDILPTQQGCDSTYILNLTVHQAYEQTQYAAVCEGQSFIWHGNPYNATGEYYDSLVTQFGCDSVFHLLLTVNPLPVVALSGLEAFYCEYNPPASASGTPPGGEFGGPGMFGNTFIPSNANQGNNTIVYTYVSSSGCANSDTLVIWVDECASLADAGKTGVNVFPNPTGGILNINLSEAGLHKLILSDAIGQVVFSREVPGKQVLQVDLSRMVAGVYMLKIESGSGIVVKRIVVER